MSKLEEIFFFFSHGACILGRRQRGEEGNIWAVNEGKKRVRWW